MADFILTVVAVLVVGGLGFGLVAFTIGRVPGLSEPEPDSAAARVPTDRQLTADDLAQARFDVVVRGYRMDQVDRLVAASADTVRELNERVRVLEEEAADLRRVRDGDPA